MDNTNICVCGQAAIGCSSVRSLVWPSYCILRERKLADRNRQGTAPTQINKRSESNKLHLTARTLLYSAYAVYWNHGIVVAKDESTKPHAKVKEPYVLRYSLLMKKAIVQQDNLYHKINKLCTNNRQERNRLYNTTRKAEEMCEMPTRKMVPMSVWSKNYCALKGYRITKFYLQLPDSVLVSVTLLKNIKIKPSSL